MKIGDWETHPAADLLPMLEGDAYRQLSENIRAQGLKETVKLYEGKVLDGRNRLKACLEVGIQPRFESWKGEDPWEHVWALNAERRHLSQGQRAALRLEFDEAIAAHKRAVAQAANEARAAARKRRRRAEDASEGEDEQQNGESVQTFAPTSPKLPKTNEALAKAADVSHFTAHKALRVREVSPELHKKVIAGEMSLEKAYRQTRAAENPEWHKHEAYYTPEWAVELLVKSGYLPKAVGLAVEPCVGGGVFVLGMRSMVKEWITCDVRKVDPAHEGLHVTGSWLEANRWDQATLRRLAQAELVISNPAFAIAREVVEMAWAVCPKAQVWILQRRTWHDQARADWFRDRQPDEINIGERLRFVRPDGSLVGDGTDNTIHTLYGFSAAYSNKRTGPHGGISRTLVRDKRRAA